MQHSARTAAAVTLLLLSASACHRFEPVTDPSALSGVRGRLSLTPEARAVHAQRLGGVVSEIIGTISMAGADSISILTDEVRFADLGRVPYAQGDLRFSRREVEGIGREVLDRRRSTIAAALGVAVVAIAGSIFSPGDGFLGIGRTAKPTPR